MEISVKWIAIGIFCFEVSLCAAYYNEYIVEDHCKYGNETIIYETSKVGAGTLKATSRPPYKPDKNCTIIIKPPADRGIVLSIRRIDMREWRYFCHDYIKIYHSDRYTSPSIVCRFKFDLEETESFYTKGPMTIIYHVGPALFPAFTFEEGFTVTYTVVSEDFQDCVKRNTFRCNNGRCIPNDLTCDGRNNCGDSSDESHEVCGSKRQYRKKFQAHEQYYRAHIWIHPWACSQLDTPHDSLKRQHAKTIAPTALQPAHIWIPSGPCSQLDTPHSFYLYPDMSTVAEYPVVSKPRGVFRYEHDPDPLADLQKMDHIYIAIFSVLIVCIVISSAVALSRRRGRRLVDTDSVSDQDEPTSRLAPFQAVHPNRFFICQNPAGPNSLYPQHSKVVHSEGGFTNPCYPHGIPQPPPPYSQ